jgi:Phytochelatin synthase
MLAVAGTSIMMLVVRHSFIFCCRLRLSFSREESAAGPMETTSNGTTLQDTPPLKDTSRTESLAKNSLQTLPKSNQPSFYKRDLPASCIAFTSAKGKQLFRQALLEQEYMEAYFALSMQFLTQSEPAYCGLGSLCMVLNALEVDPMRQWKGVWRWYDETMLDCCRSLQEIQQSGITLGEFVCIAKCNGLEATKCRADLV